MNIIQQSEMLKDVPDGRLYQEMQQPTGQFPLYLVTSEAKRRADLRQGAAGAQATPPTTTVQQELMAALAGQHAATQPKAAPGPQGPPPPQQMSPQMPPQGGVGSAPRMLPPQGINAAPPQQAPMPTNLAQGPQVAQQSGIPGMAQGGIIRGFANGPYRTPGQDVGERARLIRGAAANRRAAIANQEALARARAARDYNTEMTRQDIDIPPYDMPPGKFSEADVRPPVGRMADRPVPDVGVGEEGDSPIPEYLKPFMLSSKREGVQIDSLNALGGLDQGVPSKASIPSTSYTPHPDITSPPARAPMSGDVRLPVPKPAVDPYAGVADPRKGFKQGDGNRPPIISSPASGDSVAKTPWIPARYRYKDGYPALTHPKKEIALPPAIVDTLESQPELGEDMNTRIPLGLSEAALAFNSGREDSYGQPSPDDWTAPHQRAGTSGAGDLTKPTAKISLHKRPVTQAEAERVQANRDAVMDPPGAEINEDGTYKYPRRKGLAAMGVGSPPSGASNLKKYTDVPDPAPLPNNTKLVQMAREQVAANNPDPYTKFADILKEREAKAEGADKKDFWMDVAKAGFGMAQAGSKPGATVLGSMAEGGGDFLTAATASKKARTERADKNLALNMQITGLKRDFKRDMEALAVAQAKGEIDTITANNKAAARRVELQNQVTRAQNSEAQQAAALKSQETQHRDTQQSLTRRHSETLAQRNRHQSQIKALEYAKEENKYNQMLSRMTHDKKLAKLQRDADSASVKAYKFVSGIKDPTKRAAAEAALFPKSLTLSKAKKDNLAIFHKAVRETGVDVAEMTPEDRRRLAKTYIGLHGRSDFLSMFIGAGYSLGPGKTNLTKKGGVLTHPGRTIP